MRLLAVPVLATAVIAAAGSTVSGAAPRPVFTSKSARVTNRWFPLKPGTILTYTGVKDGKRARDVVRVTRKRERINGVLCRAVADRGYESGRLSERTTDWYAQDRAGNVWYFGERTAELDARGKVKSREGSFKDGLHGAHKGLFMPAHPRVGQSFQQEFFKGHAEDRFKILSLSARARTPAVSSRHAMLTKETTPLEPGVVDHKLYVRGIGTVVERTVRGGVEHFTLVSIRHR